MAVRGERMRDTGTTERDRSTVDRNWARGYIAGVATAIVVGTIVEIIQRVWPV